MTTHQRADSAKELRRIAIDVSVLRHGATSGTAVYVYNLTRTLLQLPNPREVILYFGARSSAAATELLDELREVGGRVVKGSAPWRWSPDGGWWLPVQPDLREVLNEVDVFHVGEFFLPPPGVCPYVATVYDVTTELFPQLHIRWNRWLHRRRLRWITRYANRIIAISESTRQDLLRMAPQAAQRSVCIHLAHGSSAIPRFDDADTVARVLARYGLTDRRYVFSVGTLEPRKNHRRLIEAFEALPESLHDVELAFAGGRGWKDAAVREALSGSSASNRINVLGFVPAGDLQALYAGATVFAFPSLYEGFGLPILEAMATGTPVLTSNVSSMPEVAGDAAILVDPTSPESIRSGLERLLTDAELRAQLSARGRARASQFSWRRTAEQTLEVYRKAIEEHRTRVRQQERA